MISSPHPDSGDYVTKDVGAKSSSLSLLDKRISLFLFIALWVSYSLIGPGWAAFNSNTITRMGLVYSIVQNHALDINAYAPYTIDKASFNGNYYSDKAPGLSFAALPFFAVFDGAARLLNIDTNLITRGSPPLNNFSIYTDAIYNNLSMFYRLSVWGASIFTSALFTAAAAAMFYRLARFWHISRAAALFGVLSYAIATPAAGWATMFFSHAMATCCLFLSFAFIVFASDAEEKPQRALTGGALAGIFLSWSVVTEYTAVPAALTLAIFGLWRLRHFAATYRRMVLAGAVTSGALIGLLLTLYNYLVFGSPISIGYGYVTGFSEMQKHFFGIGLPKWDTLAAILWGRDRGILWLSPLLILTPVAYVRAFRFFRRDVALVLFVIPLCYLWINSSYFYWNGGNSTGPRHITPMLPFICFAFMALWETADQALRKILVATVILSAVLSFICAITSMVSPEWFKVDELSQYIFPEFFAGRTHSLLSALGFHDRYLIFVLPVVWGLIALVTLPGSRQWLKNFLQEMERVN